MGKTSSVKVKGVYTPRLLLWSKGVFDKVLHTGGLDPASGELASSYVTGQIARFESACEKRLAVADVKLKPVWLEADQLLVDYAKLRRSDSFAEHVDNSDNGVSARAREKAETAKAAREAERVAIVKRLSELGNLILAEAFQVDEEITAMIKQLSSAFSAYGHGLLLKPVYKHMLPTIDTDKYSADKLCSLHEVTRRMMLNVVKEELQNHVV